MTPVRAIQGPQKRPMVPTWKGRPTGHYIERVFVPELARHLRVRSERVEKLAKSFGQLHKTSVLGREIRWVTPRVAQRIIFHMRVEQGEAWLERTKKWTKRRQRRFGLIP